MARIVKAIAPAVLRSSELRNCKSRIYSLGIRLRISVQHIIQLIFFPEFAFGVMEDTE